MGTTRYKISKEQLERVVENFVMEAASIESKKAPVKNHIPSQGAEAKKHVKNKITGKIIEKGEGVPNVTPMKKKLSQAPEAKKFVSNSKKTHTNKAKVVKENESLEEGKWGEFWGSNWSKEKAEKAYLQSYAKNISSIAEKLNTDKAIIKAAIIEFMVENGGLLVLGGEKRNGQWNGKTNKFERLDTKGYSVNPYE